ncbi:MAG TPA: hypothetical protein VF857_00605 [Spirochaetota bacterium]
MILASLETSFLSQSSDLYMLVRYPAGSFLDTYRALSSSDPYVRIAGYYGAQEQRLATKTFLLDRFKSEKDPVVRKTIIMMLRDISLDDYNRIVKMNPELKPKEGRIINHPPFMF